MKNFHLHFFKNEKFTFKFVYLIFKVSKRPIFVFLIILEQQILFLETYKDINKYRFRYIQSKSKLEMTLRSWSIRMGAAKSLFSKIMAIKTIIDCVSLIIILNFRNLQNLFAVKILYDILSLFFERPTF